jgi:cytochrome c-type biogenesis protein CcmH
MTAFFVGVLVLVAAALAWLLPPLLRARPRAAVSGNTVSLAVYRDQLRELEADLRAGTLAPEQHETARQEIERRLLEEIPAEAQVPARPGRSVLGAAALGVALPVCALIVYLAVGTPQAIVPGAMEQAAGAQPEMNAQVTDAQILAMVERLSERLKKNPDNPEGWAMLGKSYGVMGRYQEAVGAYAEALKRMPEKGTDTAQLLVDQADALAMSQGQDLLGEPEKLIARALSADPDNVKALALSGAVSFHRKDYARAARTWERILKLLPPDSDIAEKVRESIGEARMMQKATAR